MNQMLLVKRTWNESDAHRQPDHRRITQTGISFGWKKESIIPKVFQFSDVPGRNADFLSTLSEEPVSLV